MTSPRRTFSGRNSALTSLAISLRTYAEAALMVAASTFAGLLISPRWGAAPVDLLYLPPVLVAGSLFGLRYALFAAITSALCYNFFFTVPVHTFRMDRFADVVTVTILFLVAVVTSQLAARMRAQRGIAEANAARNATIAGFSRQLLATSTEEDIGVVACREIAHLFACNAALLIPHEPAPSIVARFPSAAPLTPSDLAAGALVLESGLPAGRGAPRADPADWLFHAIKSGSEVLAAMGLARDDGLPPVPEDRAALLSSLLDQLALALERARLEAEMRGVAQLRERDELRGALLSSVGHDLRTPLTAITAAAAELRDAASGRSAELAAVVAGEAGKLERYIANLLDMARIEAGSIRLNREPVDLVDAVSAATRDLRQILAGHEVQIILPVGLPLVVADPQLLHHCLINILDNAARYSPPGGGVRVEANEANGGILLLVIDEGPGLAQPEAMFETFARIAGNDRTGGAGLGLAIVSGFAHAMGIGVVARNREDTNGALVGLHFPEELVSADSKEEGDEQAA